MRFTLQFPRADVQRAHGRRPFGRDSSGLFLHRANVTGCMNAGSRSTRLRACPRIRLSDRRYSFIHSDGSVRSVRLRHADHKPAWLYLFSRRSRQPAETTAAIATPAPPPTQDWGDADDRGDEDRAHSIAEEGHPVESGMTEVPVGVQLPARLLRGAFGQPSSPSTASARVVPACFTTCIGERPGQRQDRGDQFVRPWRASAAASTPMVPWR